MFPVPRTFFDSLDQARLTDSITNIIWIFQNIKTEREGEMRLKNLGLMIDGEFDLCKSTIVVLVLFGYKPHKTLYRSGLRWMSFSGTDNGL